MHNYQIAGKEDASEQETVRLPSMEKDCVGGGKTEYLRQDKMNSGTGQSRRTAAGGYRLAAAGIAGALLAVNAAAAVPAAQIPDRDLVNESEVLPSAAAGSGLWWDDKDADSEEDGGASDGGAGQSVYDWDEDAILDRWDLDPDDFPSDEEQDSSGIPEECRSYFQEAVSEAVAWYAGDTPPAADLSKYSARADAIRTAAAERAQESVQEERDELLQMSRTLLSSVGGKAGQELVAGLQNDVFSRTPAYSMQVFATPGSGSYARDMDDPDFVMTAGKNRNHRIDGPDSVDMFLAGKEKKAGDAVRADDAEEADAAEKDSADAAEQDSAEPADSEEFAESADSEESADSGSSAAADQAASTAGRTVRRPAFKYLLTAPFAYNTNPEVYQPQSTTMPLPVGVYPYTKPYFTAAEQEDREDEAVTSGDSAPDAYTAKADEGSLDTESAEGTGSFIPFRYYGNGGGGSAASSEHRRIVFIGDSRTVGMEMSCGGQPDEYWSARTSMGYNWMVSSGIPNVEHLIDGNTDVVILMGVNDLGNVYRYIDHINYKAEQWNKLGARTFFVSVTPVDDRRSPNAKNSRIESFNAYAQENLKDVYYIDAYSRIRYTFGSPDGIHFSSSTYWDIYKIIKFSLYRGWYEQDGLWFYFDNGKPLTGWQYLDGQWQYMDGYGVRWIKDGRTGESVCIPMPDFTMKGADTDSLSSAEQLWDLGSQEQ